MNATNTGLIDVEKLTGGFTKAQLVAEAKHALGLRERVFPEWVKLGRLSNGEALSRIAKQKAIVAVLQALPESPAVQPDLFGGRP